MSLNYMSTKLGQVQDDRGTNPSFDYAPAGAPLRKTEATNPSFDYAPAGAALRMTEAQTRPSTTRAKFILSERSESKGSR